MKTKAVFSETVEKFRVGGEIAIDDGRLGVPVTLNAFLSAERAAHAVLYVTGTNTPRVGRTDDETIIRSLLERDNLVIVIDCGNHPAAVYPELDWSLQALRTKFMNGELPGFDALDGRISDFDRRQLLILPAGYNVEFDFVYWEIDKHASDGTLEQIASVWNTDLRGCRGESEVVWNREKPVTEDFSFENPDCFLGWVDKEKGDFRTRLKYTLVRDIFDCVRPDGSPIDMKLYMCLIYPSDPAKAVPVMILASSAGSLAGSWTTPTRPHLTGFLLRGYAGVIFDYGYTPMARVDHYNYFDGWPMPGAVTGDNCTYSVNVYNERMADAAAVRAIRYLAATDGRFHFDMQALGVYGNSKSGHVTILGEEHPEWYTEPRLLKGHHGETRYENGKTADEKWVHGGEEQPFLTYPDGTPIPSNVNFTIATSGGGNMPYTPGHAPMYTVCTMGEPDCGRSSYGPNVNACRINDIPCLYLASPGLGHDLAHGTDRRYGIDTYEAEFLFADYWMNHGKALCMWSEPRDGDADIDTKTAVTLHFTGAVSAEEIQKIRVESTDGHRAEGTFTPSYGRTEWRFTPVLLKGGAEYRITVPESIKAENGLPLGRAFAASFKTKAQEAVSCVTDIELKEMTTEDGPTFLVQNYEVGIRDRYLLRFRVKNDAVNTVRVMVVSTRGAFHSVKGRYGEMRRIRVCGAGVYETDITELLRAQENFGSMQVQLRLAYEPGETLRTLTPGLCEMKPGSAAVQSIVDCEGKPVLRTEYIKNNEGSYPGEAFLASPADIVTYPHLFKDGPLTEDDEGRRFRVEIDWRDSVRRSIRVNVEPIGVRGVYELLDFDANRYWLWTEPGAWQIFRFETSFKNKLCLDERMQKNTLNIALESMGDRTVLEDDGECLNPLCPFDLGEVRVTELITGVETDGENPFSVLREKLPH